MSSESTKSTKSTKSSKSPGAGGRARRRPPLDRGSVVAAGIAVADAGGLGALTMRRVGETLGVEAMSLYHHVVDKDALLDAMIDAVFAEIEPPRIGSPWREELRRRSHSARAVLRRHPWAIGVLESRSNPGPATLRHHDAVLGCLRTDGFTLVATAHAFALLDSYVYGFALQENALPFEGPADLAELGEAVLEQLAGEMPHMAEMVTQHALRPGYRFGDEFEVGLELVLDAIGGLRSS